MGKYIDEFAALAALIGWLMGMVLAQGKLKVFAALFPPYAWYLVVEKAMRLSGWL